MKTKKSEVFAGTLNQRGSLRILARKVGSDTYLAQIIRLVQEAQGQYQRHLPSIQQQARTLDAGKVVAMVRGV